MTLRYTTPIPNAFFDEWLVLLSAVSIRVFLKIARNTLGWRNQYGEAKPRDWISHSQFGDIGVSRRSVTTAVEELLKYELITVSDEQGNSLQDPKTRKRSHRIYYAVHPRLTANIALNNVNSAQNKAKQRTKTTQLFPNTKEIDKRKYNAIERISDNERLEQIRQEHIKTQEKRDSWL